MALWLRHNNLYTRVARGTDEEKEWLRKTLTFDNSKKAYFSKESARVSVYNVLDEAFPSGCLPDVLEAARIQKIDIEVLDVRTPPGKILGREETAWLRGYQHDATDAAIFHTRGILKLGTGAGKSECAAALVKRVEASWCFVVHRTQLAEQMADRFRLRTKDDALGFEVGFIGDSKWAPQSRLTVATFQTLAKAEGAAKQKWFDSITGLIVDEAHTIPAKSYMETVMKFRQAYYRIGLSGTPLDRKDKRSFFAVASTGPVIYSYTAGELVEDGVLAKPRINLVPVVQKGEFSNWDTAYKALIANSGVRNRFVIAACQKSKKPALCFVKLVEHGKRLAQSLNARGVKAQFVWGSDSLQSRKDAVKRLVRGDIEVLVCSVIFNEGIDIPDLNSVIIAPGGDSVIATLQRIGRGMRLSEGKTTFEVWDFLDLGNKWIERHAKERKRAYMRERFEVFETALQPVSALAEEAPRGEVDLDALEEFLDL